MGIEGTTRKRIEPDRSRKRFKTLLRVFMFAIIMEECGEESIWSLPLDRIDLEQGKIYISPVDQDGGLSKDRKPIQQVKFKPKFREDDDRQPIVGKLRDFLAEDLADRNEDERWFSAQRATEVYGLRVLMGSPKESKKFLMN